jgi:2Fe-2S ferredoxin
MPKITYRQPDGSTTTVDVPVGTSIMRGAVSNGIPGIVAECGGGASCATCHVYAPQDEGWPLPDRHELEDELLECTTSPRRENSRLSCQLPVTEELDGMVVDLPESQVR